MPIGFAIKYLRCQPELNARLIVKGYLAQHRTVITLSKDIYGTNDRRDDGLSHRRIVSRSALNATQPRPPDTSDVIYPQLKFTHRPASGRELRAIDRSTSLDLEIEDRDRQPLAQESNRVNRNRANIVAASRASRSLTPPHGIQSRNRRPSVARVSVSMCTGLFGPDSLNRVLSPRDPSGRLSIAPEPPGPTLTFLESATPAPRSRSCALPPNPSA